MNEFEIFKITYTVYLTNPTGLRDEDKGQVTPFDFHGEYSGVAEPCFPLKEPPNIPVKRANLSANESQ